MRDNVRGGPGALSRSERTTKPAARQATRRELRAAKRNLYDAQALIDGDPLLSDFRDFNEGD